MDVFQSQQIFIENELKKLEILLSVDEYFRIKRKKIWTYALIGDLHARKMWESLPIQSIPDEFKGKFYGREELTAVKLCNNKDNCLEDIIQWGPDFAFIICGSNDIYENEDLVSGAFFANKIFQISQKLQKHNITCFVLSMCERYENPNANAENRIFKEGSIVTQSVYHNRAMSTNKVLKNIVPHGRYIEWPSDLRPAEKYCDGVHLYTEGYQQILDLLGTTLKSVTGQTLSDDCNEALNHIQNKDQMVEDQCKLFDTDSDGGDNGEYIHNEKMELPNQLAKENSSPIKKQKIKVECEVFDTNSNGENEEEYNHNEKTELPNQLMKIDNSSNKDQKIEDEYKLFDTKSDGRGDDVYNNKDNAELHNQVPNKIRSSNNNLKEEKECKRLDTKSDGEGDNINNHNKNTECPNQLVNKNSSSNIDEESKQIDTKSDSEDKGENNHNKNIELLKQLANKISSPNSNSKVVEESKGVDSKSDSEGDDENNHKKNTELPDELENRNSSPELCKATISQKDHDDTSDSDDDDDDLDDLFDTVGAELMAAENKDTEKIESKDDVPVLEIELDYEMDIDSDIEQAEDLENAREVNDSVLKAKTMDTTEDQPEVRKLASEIMVGQQKKRPRIKLEPGTASQLVKIDVPLEFASQVKKYVNQLILAKHMARIDPNLLLYPDEEDSN